MEAAFSPLVHRKRTFWEFLSGVDVRLQQLQQKTAAADQAKALARQRTELISELQKLALATADLEATEIKVQRQLVQNRIELLEAQVREAELAEQLRQMPRQMKYRLETERLEAVRRQRELIDAIWPEDKQEEATGPERELADERARVRFRARGQQSLIADCLRELDRILHSRLDEFEKGMRARAVLEAYNLDSSQVPAKYRALLDFDDEQYQDHRDELDVDDYEDDDDVDNGY